MRNRISRIFQFITKVRKQHFVFTVDMDSRKSVDHALDSACKWASDKKIRFPWKKVKKLANAITKILRARRGA